MATTTNILGGAGAGPIRPVTNNLNTLMDAFSQVNPSHTHLTIPVPNYGWKPDSKNPSLKSPSMNVKKVENGFIITVSKTTSPEDDETFVATTTIELLQVLRDIYDK